jgi:hypothetical protein
MDSNHHYLPYEFDYSDMPDVNISDPQLFQLAMNIIAQYQQNQSRIQQQSLYEQLLSLGVTPETAAAFHVGPAGTQPSTPTTYGSLPNLRSSASHLHMPRNNMEHQAFNPDSFLPWFEGNQHGSGSVVGASLHANSSVPHLPMLSAPPIDKGESKSSQSSQGLADRPQRTQRRSSTAGSLSATGQAGPSKTKALSSFNYLPEELAGRKPASPPATTAEEKRQRNTEASTRFRMKKKLKTLNIQRLVADLTGRAEELEKEAEELRKENGWLKEIVALKGRPTDPHEGPQRSIESRESR